ncbi:MAG: outer membrane protein transport protein [Rhodocyclaceae bacterium]|jgi:long-chain fatty acid transport protein|nr:outer membrane protein transport protein [Rhodocyclaceae bacterium]MCO5097869.1 outer membrane protein transport protein [Rhodocyclaceae bacterium]
MKLKRILGVMAVAGLTVPGMAWATNGYFSHGYGMKAKGMGGVGIALPQDALAAATNPAGMVMVGDRLDVGVDWFRPIRDSEIVGSGAPVNGDYNGSDQKNFFVPEFGYNKMLGWNMSLGVSVYGNGGMNTNYKNGIPLFDGVPPIARAGVDLSQLFIAPTFAYKINKNHAVGVSLNLAYQRFKAYGLQNFTAPGFSVSSSDVTNNGYDSSTGWGIKLGYTGNLTDAVTVGATYQSRTRMGKFSDYKGLFAERGDFDIPENYGIGIAVKATPQLTIAADIMQINYGEIDAVANKVDCFFAGMCQLGASNGPGFGWGDMTVFKLGLSYAYSQNLTLRGGFSTTNQPISKSQTLFNMLAPGVIENHLTLGATWATSPTSEWTVSYMHGFSKKVNGSSSISAGFGGGNANLKMYQDSLGIAYGMKF